MVASLSTKKSQPSAEESSFSFFLRHQAFVILGLVACALLYIASNVTVTNETESQFPVVIEEKKTNLISSYDHVCQDVCHLVEQARIKKFHGDLMDRSELLRLAKEAKDELHNKLRDDYGEYFEPIFIGPGKSFSPISSNGGSMERIKRKLMIKILSVQAEILEKDKDINNCDCSNGGRALATNITTHFPGGLKIDDHFVQYVWATGGHSAAAGHGNLHRESYTGVMGDDVRSVFGAIGIRFEDRNYAMGGTASANEISMCWEQIFGQDVDFFSWDYGMTDGNYDQRLLHYGYRGGISHGRPAFLGMRLGGRALARRQAALRSLEDMGMAAFEGSEASYQIRNDAIPDSAGISEEEIQNLPRLVRNFKCGVKIESGDPYCDKEKYTHDVCPRRSKQASWHPGFKSHALDGHALALFLVDTLIETLEDLVNHNTSEVSTLLTDLQQEEDELFESLLSAELPAAAPSLYMPPANSPIDETLNLETLWKGPSLCRTARLPAQSRYLGYTTNSDKIGGMSIVGKEEYDLGLDIIDAKKPDAMKDGLLLTYEPLTEREKCEVLLKPDYKDYFYAHEVHGWTHLSIPNDKEKDAYNYNPSDFTGFIGMSLIGCSWGKCAKGELREVDYADGKFEITVNGEPVTELISIGFDVAFMKGAQGLTWQPNESGTFDIGFLMKEPGGYIKISSFILY